MSDEICPITSEIMKEEPIPEMSDEYYELSESEQDSLTYAEGVEYYKNKDEYEQKRVNHKIKMIKHMLNCNHQDCKNTLALWSTDEDRELVRKITTQQVK
jgi:hypothetical protein